jgi:nucleotide-binding universal stress UspA family protein
VFRNILVPLDGSPLGEQALPMALSVARRAKAALHVVLVHVPDEYHDYAHCEALDAEALERESKYLSALRARLAPAFRGPLQVHHRQGLIQETLTAEVGEQQIDLVIMSAHGWGYVSRAIMGSVSDYLMRHLSVPLLLMHGQTSDASLAQELSLRRMLVCLDGSPLAETILGPAMELARLWESQLHLLRVVSPPEGLGHSHDDEQRALYQDVANKATAAARGYLDKTANCIQGTGLCAKSHIVLNRNVTQAILQEAIGTGCNLISISTHGRGGLSRLLLGSEADKIVRGAQTPVLVYRPAS